MQKLKREGLSLLFKLGRAIAESEDSTEEPEEVPVPAEDIKEEPMKAYWESDKEEYRKKNQPFIDLFLKDVALERIPDTTEKPVKESHYSYDTLSRVYLPEVLKNYNANKGVPDTTSKAGSGISSSGRDASVVAGIVVAVISGVIILGALIAVVMYRHYVHRNVTSMNFDNPVYRKTTENQFALEQNGYAPGSKLYPSTVGEESQEPLNTPGTNDFV